MHHMGDDRAGLARSVLAACPPKVRPPITHGVLTHIIRSTGMGQVRPASAAAHPGISLWHHTTGFPQLPGYTLPSIELPNPLLAVLREQPELSYFCFSGAFDCQFASGRREG